MILSWYTEIKSLNSFLSILYNFNHVGGIYKCNKRVGSKGSTWSWKILRSYKVTWSSCSLPESGGCFCSEDYRTWRLEPVRVCLQNLSYPYFVMFVPPDFVGAAGDFMAIPGFVDWITKILNYNIRLFWGKVLFAEKCSYGICPYCARQDKLWNEDYSYHTWNWYLLLGFIIHFSFFIRCRVCLVHLPFSCLSESDLDVCKYKCNQCMWLLKKLNAVPSGDPSRGGVLLYYFVCGNKLIIIPLILLWTVNYFILYKYHNCIQMDQKVRLNQVIPCRM